MPDDRGYRCAWCVAVSLHNPAVAVRLTSWPQQVTTSGLGWYRFLYFREYEFGNPVYQPGYVEVGDWDPAAGTLAVRIGDTTGGAFSDPNRFGPGNEVHVLRILNPGPSQQVTDWHMRVLRYAISSKVVEMHLIPATVWSDDVDRGYGIPMHVLCPWAYRRLNGTRCTIQERTDTCAKTWDACKSKLRNQLSDNASSFETSVSDWAAVGGATISRTSAGGAVHGQYAMAMENLTAAGRGARMVDAARVSEGNVWALAARASSGTPQLDVTAQYYDAAENLVYSLTTTVTLSAQWQTFSRRTYPPNYAKARLRLTVPAATTATIYVDAVYMSNEHFTAFVLNSEGNLAEFGGLIAALTRGTRIDVSPAEYRAPVVIVQPAPQPTPPPPEYRQPRRGLPREPQPVPAIPLPDIPKRLPVEPPEEGIE